MRRLLGKFVILFLAACSVSLDHAERREKVDVRGFSPVSAVLALGLEWRLNAAHLPQMRPFYIAESNAIADALEARGKAVGTPVHVQDSEGMSVNYLPDPEMPAVTGEPALAAAYINLTENTCYNCQGKASWRADPWPRTNAERRKQARAAFSESLVPSLRKLYEAAGLACTARTAEQLTPVSVAFVAAELSAVFALETALKLIEKNSYCKPVLILVNPVFFYDIPDLEERPLEKLPTEVVWTRQAYVDTYKRKVGDGVDTLRLLHSLNDLPLAHGVTHQDSFKTQLVSPWSRAQARKVPEMVASHILDTVGLLGTEDYFGSGDTVSTYTPDFALERSFRHRSETSTDDYFPVSATPGHQQTESSIERRVVFMTGGQLRRFRISRFHDQNDAGLDILRDYNFAPDTKQQRISQAEWTVNRLIGGVLDELPTRAWVERVLAYTRQATPLEVPIAFVEPQDEGEQRTGPRRARYFMRRDLLFMLAFLSAGDAQRFAAPSLLNRTLQRKVDALKALKDTVRRLNAGDYAVVTPSWLETRINVTSPRSLANLSLMWRAVSRTYAAMLWARSLEDADARAAALESARALRQSLLVYLGGSVDSASNRRHQTFLEKFDTDFEQAGFAAAVRALEPRARPRDASSYYAVFIPDTFFDHLEERYQYRFSVAAPLDYALLHAPE